MEKRVQRVKTPEEYVATIDNRYNDAKKRGIPRVDVSWGMWSAEMNRTTRKYTQQNPRSEEAGYFKLVYEYWVITSQLLDLHYRRRTTQIFKKAMIKQLSKERKQLRNIIINKKLHHDIEFDALGRMR